MEQKKEVLPYFMSYGIEENSFDHDNSKRDKDYFRQLYSSEMKIYLKIIEEVLNMVGGNQSFIFHEYPDKIRLDQLVEQVLDKIPLQNKIPREGQRQIVRVLLYEEIYRRRNKL